MGVLGHGDWLRGKYVTAIVSDHNDRAYAVPIKHVIGDYFLADISGNLYAFTVRGARILTIGDVASRQARFILYDTSNYKPLDTAKLGKLADVLAANGLGRVDGSLLALLTLLGKAEARRDAAARKAADAHKKGAKWKPHELAEIMALIDAHAEMYPDEAAALKLYVTEIDIERVVTPVRKVADYLTDELVTTDPSFLGELSSRWARMDMENKAMTNTPKSSGTSWVKVGVVMALVVGVVGIIGIGASEGWFSNLTFGIGEGLDFESVGKAFSPGGLSGGGGGSFMGSLTPGPDCSASGIQARYASPLDMAVAVDSGAETCDPLPKEITDALAVVELPRAAEPEPAPAPAP